MSSLGAQAGGTWCSSGDGAVRQSWHPGDARVIGVREDGACSHPRVCTKISAEALGRGIGMRGVHDPIHSVTVCAGSTIHSAGARWLLRCFSRELGPSTKVEGWIWIEVEHVFNQDQQIMCVCECVLTYLFSTIF